MKLKDKVLVVEDEQNISNFISTVLTANDFDVLMAQTGAEAISMITSHCPISSFSILAFPIWTE